MGKKMETAALLVTTALKRVVTKYTAVTSPTGLPWPACTTHCGDAGWCGMGDGMVWQPSVYVDGVEPWKNSALCLP